MKHNVTTALIITPTTSCNHQFKMMSLQTHYQYILLSITDTQITHHQSDNTDVYEQYKLFSKSKAHNKLTLKTQRF